MLTKGYDKKSAEMKEIRRQLKMEVRRDFRALMGWKMPLSRKVLLVLVCL